MKTNYEEYRLMNSIRVELRVQNRLTILKELYRIGCITKENYEKDLKEAWKEENNF